MQSDESNELMRSLCGNQFTRSRSTIHFHFLNIQSLVMLDDVPCEEAGKAGQALQEAVDSCKIQSMRKCVNTFEKNGGLSRLEQAVELFRVGELVYNEPLTGHAV